MRSVNQAAFLSGPMHIFRAFVSSEVVTGWQNVEAHIGAIARPFLEDFLGFGSVRNDTPDVFKGHVQGLGDAR